MWGKNKQKRHPRYLEWRLMLGWITSLRSVFPSSAGRHRQSKSASCMRRTTFFVIRRPVQEQALDGPTYNKKAQPLRLRFRFGRDSVGKGKTKMG